MLSLYQKLENLPKSVNSVISLKVGIRSQFLVFEIIFICFTLQEYYNQLFGIKTINSNSVSQALCLPVSVSELVEVNQSSKVC